MEESWCDEVKRKHPFRWRWEGFKFSLDNAWGWLWDKPVWNFSEIWNSSEVGEPFLETARTKRRLSQEEEDALSGPEDEFEKDADDRLVLTSMLGKGKLPKN